MPGTSHRARYALAATLVALSLALVAGALPMFGGASADDTRELIRVSFRPAGAAPVQGWRADHGEAYDSRRAYGWVRDNATGQPLSMRSSAVSRESASTAERTDTFITMQPPRQRWGRWVMDVRNGTYRVTVTVGDPSGADGAQHLRVEGTDVVSGFRPTRSTPLRTETVDVEVVDGRLTFDPLYPTRSTRTKLVSLVVSQVLDETPPTTEPSTTTTTTAPPTTEPTTTTTTRPPTTTTTTAPPTTLPPIVQPGDLRFQAGFAGGGVFLGSSDAEIKREMDGMAATGATWLRMGFFWSSIEQEPGTYYFRRLDEVVGWARERGLRIVANVSYTPRWAQSDGCRDTMCPPASNADYARFMGDLVRHYAPLGVKHYEVWNEPNQYFWWKPRPDPARYTDMLRRAYVQAKQADPSVTILSGVFAPAPDNESGTTMNARTFLTGMYRAGAAGHFDALSYHPYHGTEDPRVVAPWNMVTGVGPDLVAIMRANGEGGKRIWGTEMSVATGRSQKSVSEAEQAVLLQLAFQVWRQQEWAGPLFMFTYRDMGTDPSDPDQNYGLVKRDFTPKQALWSMREFLR